MAEKWPKNDQGTDQNKPPMHFKSHHDASANATKQRADDISKDSQDEGKSFLLHSQKIKSQSISYALSNIAGLRNFDLSETSQPHSTSAMAMASGTMCDLQRQSKGWLSEKPVRRDTRAA